MRSGIVIIHFQPLEFYPPVMNLLQGFSAKKLSNIVVLTHKNEKNIKSASFEGINIHRFRSAKNGNIGFSRFLNYIKINFLCFLILIRCKPRQIIYFETLSALPVFLFYLFTFRKTQLAIHFHEYTSPQEYKCGMKMVYFNYLLEKKYLWNRTLWISQTNKKRIELFINDYPNLNPNKLHILPNYPPKSWQAYAKETKQHDIPIKVIYVGSLGLDNFYLKEFCDWVIAQNGVVQFDIYSQNSTLSAQKYIAQLNSPFIRLNYKWVWYYELPKILSQYDVGIILYKPFNENFTNNETNKLFEYHVCGLDVWFSEETIGIHQHITKDSYPKIIPLNFNRLENFNLKSAVNRDRLKFRIMDANCEEVYQQFLYEIQLKNKVISIR